MAANVMLTSLHLRRHRNRMKPQPEPSTQEVLVELKQEQSGPRRAQLLGGSNRSIEVPMKVVANDYDCLDRPLSRLLYPCGSMSLHPPGLI